MRCIFNVFFLLIVVIGVPRTISRYDPILPDLYNYASTLPTPQDNTAISKALRYSLTIGGFGTIVVLGTVQLIRHFSHSHSKNLTSDGDFDFTVIRQFQKENSNVIFEIKKEQEELWRVVHQIYKSQADRIEALENSTISILRLLESQSTAEKDQKSPSKSVLKLNKRIEALEKLYTDLQTTVLASDNEIHVLTESSSLMRNELEDIKVRLEKLKSVEIPALLDRQNDVVLSKMRGFADILKKQRHRHDDSTLSRTKSELNAELTTAQDVNKGQYTGPLWDNNDA